MSRSIKRHCSAGSQPDSLLSAEEIETTKIVGGRFELGIFGGRRGQIELANPQCHCLVEKGTQGACWVWYLCACLRYPGADRDPQKLLAGDRGSCVSFPITPPMGEHLSPRFPGRAACVAWRSTGCTRVCRVFFFAVSILRPCRPQGNPAGRYCRYHPSS